MKRQPVAPDDVGALDRDADIGRARRLDVARLDAVGGEKGRREVRHHVPARERAPVEGAQMDPVAPEILHEALDDAPQREHERAAERVRGRQRLLDLRQVERGRTAKVGDDLGGGCPHQRLHPAEKGAPLRPVEEREPRFGGQHEAVGAVGGDLGLDRAHDVVAPPRQGLGRVVVGEVARQLAPLEQVREQEPVIAVVVVGVARIKDTPRQQRLTRALQGMLKRGAAGLLVTDVEQGPHAAAPAAPRARRAAFPARFGLDRAGQLGEPARARRIGLGPCGVAQPPDDPRLRPAVDRHDALEGKGLLGQARQLAALHPLVVVARQHQPVGVAQPQQVVAAVVDALGQLRVHG